MKTGYGGGRTGTSPSIRGEKGRYMKPTVPYKVGQTAGKAVTGAKNVPGRVKALGTSEGRTAAKAAAKAQGTAARSTAGRVMSTRAGKVGVAAAVGGAVAGGLLHRSYSDSVNEARATRRI